MKHYILAYFLIFTVLQSFAQDQCGTTPPTEAEMQAKFYYGNNARLQVVYDSLANIYGNTNCTTCRNTPYGGEENIWFRIPIKFYIYQWTPTNSFLENPERRLKSMMWALNDAYRRNNIPIRFTMACPEIVENREATEGNISDNQIVDLMQQRREFPAINIHIVNRLDDGTNFYTSFADAIALRRDVVFTEIDFPFIDAIGQSIWANTTFIHEVGHYLGLNHTHSDSADACWQELVTRGRVWTWCPNSTLYGSIQCEHRGDALCDTEADPGLGDGSEVFECIWQGTRRDNRGDLYRPDQANYMAYGDRTCRNRLTASQRTILLDNAAKRNTSSNNLYSLYKDDFADIYEPDDSPAMASPIRLNESQDHAFGRFVNLNCPNYNDNNDWVSYRHIGGNINDLYLEIENIGNFNNPTGDIEFFSSDNNVNNLFPTIQRAYAGVNITPTKKSYRIACNTLVNGQIYLFRVSRNGSQTGRYKLSLKSAIPQMFGGNSLCVAIPQTYTLTDIPTWATVNWVVSNNINIVSGQGTNQLTVLVNNSGEGSIGASVSGCGTTLNLPQKNVVIGVSQVFPVNYTATPYIGQTITFTIRKPLPLDRDVYTYQPFVIPQNPNANYPWNLTSYVDTGTEIEMYVQVGTGVAEIGIEVNSCNQIIARPNVYVEGVEDPNCYYGFRVSPNPSKDFINLSRFGSQPCIGQRTYQGKLYNKFNKLLWQGEIKEDTQIDARKLSNDMYYLHITDDKGKINKEKIIISK